MTAVMMVIAVIVAIYGWSRDASGIQSVNGGEIG